MRKSFLKSDVRIFYTTILSIFIYNSASAQKNPIKYEVESQTIGTTNNTVPFWMRSNQYGSVPLSGLSQSFIGRAYKEFTPLPATDSVHTKRKLLDWGFGFEGRANLGKGSNLQLIEGYGKIRIGVFNLLAGRNKSTMGLTGDTTLSAGSFAVSGNAPGIPKIELSIPDYYPIPVWGGLFSIKGNIAHGWAGRQRLYDSDNEEYNPTTYFHQTSMYVRIGKANWKLKAYGGINHQAYWGNEQVAYGSKFDLSKVETFYYVLTGKRYGGHGVPYSKIGNQLGSVDFGFEYDFDKIKLMVYRQNFYDVGALSKLANIKDGLNGITLENKDFNNESQTFKWKKILAELFYSKDQAGYPGSRETVSGDEDYYNNFYYAKGWTYMGTGIGNPLITQREDAKDGQAVYGHEHFINNRVVAVHLGLEGSIKDWIFLTKATFSNNYGTYGTSEYGHSLGEIENPQTSNLFTKVKQFSFYLEGMKLFNNGISAGFATSFDQGDLLNNSSALLLKIKKSFP